MLNVLQTKGMGVFKLNIHKYASVHVNKQINWQFYRNRKRQGALNVSTLLFCMILRRFSAKTICCN